MIMQRSSHVALALTALLGFAFSGEAWGQVINHSGGFTGETDMTLNGTVNGAAGPVTVVGSALRVTDAQVNEARSAYETLPVAVGNFTNNFTFHILAGSTGATTGIADGIGFCIQGNAPTALGATGGQMGYQGVAKSVFIKFDPYNNGVYSATGMYLDGADPSNTGNDVNLEPAPTIDFQSGHDFSCAMTYNGTTLVVVLKDLSNNNTVTTNYAVDIPAHVGARVGYVGFCGGTGGLNSIGEIMTWTWTSLPAPTNLMATAGFNSVTLNWTAVPGATSYNIFRSGTTGGPPLTDPYVLVGTAMPGTTTTFTDLTPTFPNTYFYVVQAVVGTVTSDYSNEASCSPKQPNISAAPPAIMLAENGGTAVITVSLRVNPTSNVLVQISSGNAADITLTAPGGAPQGTITLTFMPGFPLTQQVIVTGVERGVEGPAIIVPVTFNSVTSGDANYPATYVPPPIPCTIVEDVPAIIINPPTGLATVNGGPPIMFTVSLSTMPQGNVILTLSVSDPNLATVSPILITTAGFNIPVPVTVTPLNANTQTTYIAPYDIIINSSTSTDPGYAALGDTLVPINTAVNLPPLTKVWGSHCGLLGLELAFPLGLLALWRRRRRAPGARS